MRRYVKDKNILYNDLTDQENELSASITFSFPPIEKTEKKLKEEIDFYNIKIELIIVKRRKTLFFKTKNL
jgi:hypothetical protein